MNKPAKRNLVLGFATNLDEPSIKIFCRSLRRVYNENECDLVVVTNKFENYFSELSQIGTLFLPTSNKYSGRGRFVQRLVRRLILGGARLSSKMPGLESVAPEIANAHSILFESWQHPHFVRWIAYEQFLTLNRNYHQVFLSDVKDVVFQAPFFNLDSAPEILFFDQSQIYGTSECDTAWYRDAFGERALAGISGKPALCIGTILGPYLGILQLVTALREYFVERAFRGVEQAIFNHLVHNRIIQVPHQVVQNIDGPVGTLSSKEVFDRVKVADGYIRRRADDSIIPVVHMYDRFGSSKAALTHLGD